MGMVVLGGYEHTRGVFVQAVDNAGPQLAANA